MVLRFKLVFLVVSCNRIAAVILVNQSLNGFKHGNKTADHPPLRDMRGYVLGSYVNLRLLMESDSV